MIDKFKQYMIVKRNLSKNTIENYCSRIRCYLQEYNSFTEENITNFILSLDKKTRTINSYIKAFKMYVNFAKLDIEVPKIRKVIQKDSIDSFDLKYLEKNILPMVDVVGFKNNIQVKTIFSFLFYVPLRAESELINLKREHFNFEKRMVKIVRTKTSDEHTFPFSRKLKSMLELYFSLEPEKNNAFNVGQNTITNWCKRLKPYFNDINLRPHLFKHSCLTYWLRKGMDLIMLSDFSGVSIPTLKRYYCNIKKENIRDRIDELEGNG